MFRRTGLWRHPDFLRLWAGETVSLFGSLIGRLALQFTAVLLLDASAVELAILAGASLVPGFVFGLAAGVIVDRMPRRRLMIVADFARFVTVLSVPIAWAFDILTIEQLWVVGAVTAAFNLLFEVAYEALMPTIISRDDLVEGNSKMTASASVAEFASFGLAGWLVQAFKGPGAMLIDAVSFLWSAIWLMRIRTPEPPQIPAHERESPLKEAREGLAIVARDPILRSLASSGIVFSAACSMIGAMYLLYLSRDLDFQPGVLGVIFAVGGVTSLGGSLLARRTLPGGVGPSLILARVVTSAGMLFMPLAPGVSAIGIACLVASQLVTDPAWTYFEIRAISLRQGLSDDRVLGRVNATMRFLEFGGMLVGLGVAAFVGERFGAREALFTAVGLAASSVLFLTLSPIVRLKRIPARVEVITSSPATA